jgi:hypothetical protein
MLAKIANPRLVAEAMGTVRVIYDRSKGGAIPSNLAHYLDNPNTYQIAHRRGGRAIVRVSESA